MAIWNERIHEKRIEKGITLAQVAEKLGVTEATAQRYECGSIKSIPYEYMCAYGEILNCSPAYLMGWDKKYPEPETTPKIIEYYDQLNTLGKEAATEHVRLLTLDEKYTQPDQVISIVRKPDSNYLAPDAAHSKKGASIADQEYDNKEIMDNDDLWEK